MIIVYGIKNCDTVKKALKWTRRITTLNTNFDYRIAKVRYETISKRKRDNTAGMLVVNKRSTTWRNLMYQAS